VAEVNGLADLNGLGLETALGAEIVRASPLGGQHGVAHYRLELADGRVGFAKVQRSGAGGFSLEATGLTWLAEAGAVPVAGVLAVADAFLVLEWVAEEAASKRSAERFGADLARLHASGARRFGAPWPGVIAGLPLQNEQADDWPGWYAAARLMPYVRIARDRGGFSGADARVIETVAERLTAGSLASGPAEPPSRIHGDCWSGNVVWSRGRGWLIDPAAHGGHRETDLAMLDLFGAPYLSQILGGYQDVAPLAEGWRERVPLHQLHPLLVHVCLFGAAYRDAALAAAQAALRAD
jgi:fructosamine-3-kinase